MTDDMKILCVVVLYKPNPCLLQTNLEAIVPNVDTLLLWNNTPAVVPCPYHSEKAIYINTGENVGLPTAYNYAWRYAKEHGYTHLLTMDQDSVYNGFDQVLQIAKQRNEVAIFAPYVPGPDAKQPTQECQEVLHVINSGALIPIEILDRTNGYSEEFFMDMVDDEFCYHARSLGYKIYQIKRAELIQQYGHITSIKIANKTIAQVANYSAMRLYGICRNKLILWHRYSVPSQEKIHVLWCDAKAFIKMVCFEQDKWLKTKAYALGYYDGLLQRKSRLHLFMK